jgi:protocatechuate 3,4-dioxygenase alpha subunit
VGHRAAGTWGDPDGGLIPGSTPSQTVGPFFAFGLPFEGGERLVDDGGFWIEGAVYDGAGDPVGDALVEIWQANRHGRYRHPEDTREELPLEDGFDGFGRCPTDAEGRFEFVTVKPGATDGQAPHIAVCVFARGLLRHLYTRIYFPDEAAANAADPLLSSIGDPRSRSSLVARPLDGVLAFDIRLQGERQTAFLDV